MVAPVCYFVQKTPSNQSTGGFSRLLGQQPRRLTVPDPGLPG